MLQMSAVSTMGVNSLLVLVARVLLGLHHVEVGAGALVTREAVHSHSLYHQQAVPVIHLDQGKATVEDYLSMFPEQILGKRWSDIECFHSIHTSCHAGQHHQTLSLTSD